MRECSWKTRPWFHLKQLEWLQVPVLYQDQVVTWLDSKATFGSMEVHRWAQGSAHGLARQASTEAMTHSWHQLSCTGAFLGPVLSRQMHGLATAASC